MRVMRPVYAIVYVSVFVVALSTVACSQSAPPASPAQQPTPQQQPAIGNLQPAEVFQATQTEEQKLLFDRHKKVLDEILKNKGGGIGPLSISLDYLLKRQAGVKVVENFIIESRKVIKDERQHGPYLWMTAMKKYCHPESGTVAAEDIPDRMIPELAENLLLQYDIPHIRQAGEFGPRGKAFLPALETIRDKSKIDTTVSAALDAMRRIKN